VEDLSAMAADSMWPTSQAAGNMMSGRPVFFIAHHHDPKPGFGLLSFTGLGIVAVKASWEAGVSAGGTNVSEPGERRSHGSGSYSAFLKDPDGYEIEVTVGTD